MSIFDKVDACCKYKDVVNEKYIRVEDLALTSVLH